MRNVVECILITGQSLAEGGVGGDIAPGVDTPAYPGNVFMLAPMSVARGTITSSNFLIPLVEKGRVSIGHSLTANIASENLMQDANYELIFSGQAWGGKSYQEIMPGAETKVFERLIDQVKTISTLCSKPVYLGIVCIHGEQDGLNNNHEYAVNLGALHADINRSIQEITNRSDTVPMYICQVNSASGYRNRKGILDDSFPAPLAQLEAHENNPNITLVCPKYFLEYVDQSHLSNLSTRLLGEYYAQAFRASRRGKIWSAVRPISIVGKADKVIIQFTGNQGPMTLDTNLVRAAENYGFDYYDAANNQILSVVVTDDAEVTLTLSGQIAEGARVSYAYHNGDGGKEAQSTGLGDRGNLRDSSVEKSIYDETPLFNWCVAFRKDIQLSSLAVD